MKKPVTIFALCTVLFALWATLFAQTTTGSSLITQMKAATHAFTLAGDLNPGTTGLESAPLVGKRTGDQLSAGEYNRILELVGQGGGGGSLKYHQANISVPAGTVNLDTLPGLPAGYVAAFINSCTTGGTYMDTIPMAYINNNVNTTCGWIMAAPGTHTFLAVGTSYFILSGYFTFEGGGGGGGSGSSGWVDVPLTDTADFDVKCDYIFNWIRASFVNTTRIWHITNEFDATTATTYRGIRKENKNIILYHQDNYANNTIYANETVTKIEKLCRG